MVTLSVSVSVLELELEFEFVFASVLDLFSDKSTTFVFAGANICRGCFEDAMAVLFNKAKTRKRREERFVMFIYNMVQ